MTNELTINLDTQLLIRVKDKATFETVFDKECCEWDGEQLVRISLYDLMRGYAALANSQGVINPFIMIPLSTDVVCSVNLDTPVQVNLSLSLNENVKITTFMDLLLTGVAIKDNIDNVVIDNGPGFSIIGDQPQIDSIVGNGLVRKNKK